MAKRLRSAQERMRRREALHQRHTSELTQLVDGIRLERGVTAEIPYIDPIDGGIDARVLMLLEAPGPKAVESGFVSRDNPDETAKNLLLACQAAGLPRGDTLIWNIVPWYIGDGRRIRPARVRDVLEGLPYLLCRLMPMLHKLRAVVLIGSKAERASAWIQLQYPDLRIFHCPHPSPVFVNRHPENRAKVVGALAEVARWLTQTGP